MNKSLFSRASRIKINAALAALASGIFLSASVQAQTPGDTVYFDPSVQGNTTTGGAGDFSTSDFWDPSTSLDAPFVSGSTPVVVTPYVPTPPPNGTNGTTEIATYGETAVFNGPGSTVDVSLPVTPYSLQVGVTSGTETFGTTGAEAQISMPVGNGVNQTPLVINSSGATGTENVVFNSNLNLQIAAPYYSNPNIGINSFTSGNIAVNGGITFSNYTTDGDSVGEPNLNITENVAGGTVTINSAVTAVNMPNSTPIANFPVVQLNTPGSLILTSHASFNSTEVSAQQGAILDQGATFTGPLGGPNYPINVGGTGEFLTDADNVNVTGQVEFSNGGGTIGGALADTTTFSGQEIVGYSGTAMDLTSAAGGRVNFIGDIHNGNNDSIVKVGAGTIALKNTQGRAEDQNAGWEIQNGTMLVNGTDANNSSLSGSGLEIDQVATASLVPNMQTYATLGGTGDTHVAVTADGANSSITPGDPTVNGGIGTLTLAGGLTATSGLTMNFKLNGGANSELDVTGAFSLNGPVTVNFQALGPVAIDTPYTLMKGGAGVWTKGADTSFTFNTPAGYVLDPSFGTDGYIFSTTPDGGSFSVEFIPEPSTWALMGLGLVALLAIGRFRKQQA
jgi:hypothetical protein